MYLINRVNPPDSTAHHSRYMHPLITSKVTCHLCNLPSAAPLGCRVVSADYSVTIQRDRCPMADSSTDTITLPEPTQGRERSTDDLVSDQDQNADEEVEGSGDYQRDSDNYSCDPHPSASIKASPNNESSYPEGGFRAWSVVFGSFTSQMACFGMMNSAGTFQAYLSTHQLKEYGPQTIGWIFSLYVFLAFFCGALIGPIFDVRGPTALVLVGSVCLIASMMLLGVCFGRLVSKTYG